MIGRMGRVAGTRELVLSGTSNVVAYRVKGYVDVLAVMHGTREGRISSACRNPFCAGRDHAPTRSTIVCIGRASAQRLERPCPGVSRKGAERNQRLPFSAVARSTPSRIRRCASSLSPQRTNLTHLPGSRSL